MYLVLTKIHSFSMFIYTYFIKPYDIYIYTQLQGFCSFSFVSPFSKLTYISIFLFCQVDINYIFKIFFEFTIDFFFYLL